MIPVLHTKRLTLRQIIHEDARDIFAYASDYEVTKYTAWNRHEKIENSLDFINFTLEKYKTENHYDWAIILKENKKLIGTGGFPDFNNYFHFGEMGYNISRDYWNNGYATEAVMEILTFGFNNLNLVRIQATCRIENAASERVLQKAGMSFEKILRNRLYKDNNYYDLKLYSILADEFKDFN